MDYRLLIARRYLLGQRSFSLISKITGISVAGVALGVAALIIVLSVMNGFFSFVRDMLVSFDPHVRIVSVDARGLERPDSLVQIALSLPNVVSAAPYVEGKALLLHDGMGEANKVVIVRGVDPESTGRISESIAKTGFGNFDLARREGRAGIALGRRLGERMLLTPAGGGEAASRVTLLSAAAVERSLMQPLGAAPTTVLEVRGLYELEAVYDESYVFIDVREAQRLFRTGSRVSGIDIRLKDLEDADDVQRALGTRLGSERFRILTWYDLQRSLYEVMQLEKWGAMLILVLIVVVAAFNIVGSLTMIVIEKRRDVGVLQAMGVSRKDIRRIFLSEGLLIGLAGSGLGLVAGLGLSVIQQVYQIIPLSGSDSFLIDAYPVAIQGLDVAVIGTVALVLCVLAAWYPAHRAASIVPAHAVKLDG